MFERWDDQEPTAWNLARAAFMAFASVAVVGGPIVWVLLENAETIREFVSANLGALRPN